MSSVSPSATHDRPRRSLRWAALLVASVLLHILAVNWAGGHIGLPFPAQEKPTVITTELLAPPAKPAPPVAAAPRRKPRPKRPPAAPQPSTDTVAATAPELPLAGMEAPGTSIEPATEVAAEDPQAASTETVQPEAEANATPAYKIDPPPSAELKYDVEALRDGKQWYGSGLFRWEAAGDRYSITGEASVTILFKITVLNFRSEGAINGYGIAPELYSEKPWRKSMMNTHFQHDKRTISFSASEASYPYRGGEQDRASIMWQLAAIGRGDPAQFAPGATLDIMVAGTRDAYTWRIEVLGQEEIDTGFGRLGAWHVVRVPRPGSYDQKIDIWLAPSQEWYPVKLLYTYANGDHLEMALSSLERATAAKNLSQ